MMTRIVSFEERDAVVGGIGVEGIGIGIRGRGGGGVGAMRELVGACAFISFPVWS